MNVISNQGRMVLERMVNLSFSTRQTSAVSGNCSLRFSLTASVETFVGDSKLLQVSFLQEVGEFKYRWEMTFMLIYQHWKFPVSWNDFIAVPVSYATEGQRAENCIKIGTKRIIEFDVELIRDYAVIAESLLDNLKIFGLP